MRAALAVIVLASAGLLSQVADSISLLIVQYGYPAVFAAAFLEMVFPPIPSEIVFPLVGFTAQSNGLGLENALGMAAVGALGSTAGAIVIYLVARKIGRAAILRYGRYIRMGEDDLKKAEGWFAKYGPAAVFAARMVPGVRELISIPAGIGGMKIARFTVFTFAGSLVWSTALTLVGFYVGGAWNAVAEELSAAFTIVGAVVLAGLAATIAVWYMRRKKKKSARQPSS
ncbi:DedA family protein [Nitrososphaera viennensis]|uniref:DedA family protein n=2 Tax=Nitrososphaera viennensis TaxID=1034015 RepID=A0A060HL97_9ARCH|nr:DedA family protein [Nitrososphaera viennensis]AIC17289.1 DedA family protein [Nitrososphaera viennensis EN76]UVS69172.1 DedA family protein [Nitrososphaera viennensis]